jgi:uracil-DNA glycosylase
VPTSSSVAELSTCSSRACHAMKPPRSSPDGIERSARRPIGREAGRLGDMPSLARKLDDHRAALAACNRCARSGDVSPVVSLAVAPRVMLVGQAPGQVEAQGGKPFAGRAGRTLFRWFEQAGIDEITARRKIYIAAVTRCYPGPSPSGRGDRVPSVEEQGACASWLESELAIIRPKVIIPVGKLAIERFFRPQPLDRLIGRSHVAEGRLLIPLPHPSGASSWIHQANHPQLLKDALRLLELHVAPLL